MLGEKFLLWRWLAWVNALGTSLSSTHQQAPFLPWERYNNEPNWLFLQQFNRHTFLSLPMGDISSQVNKQDQPPLQWTYDTKGCCLMHFSLGS
jgi:hypothetical protein